MSFVNEEDVMGAAERLTANLFKEILDIDLPRPFPRLTHKEAIDTYGSDKPDTRFGLETRRLGRGRRSLGVPGVQECPFRGRSGSRHQCQRLW